MTAAAFTVVLLIIAAALAALQALRGPRPDTFGWLAVMVLAIGLAVPAIAVLLR